MAAAGGRASPPAAQPLRAASTLPAFFELQVDPTWQAIDFISDLHLCASMPRTFDAWAAHLAHTPADAVFILGDLFEVWVGDDMASLPFWSVPRCCAPAASGPCPTRPCCRAGGSACC
jgi:hypothetical protein